MCYLLENPACIHSLSYISDWHKLLVSVIASVFILHDQLANIYGVRLGQRTILLPDTYDEVSWFHKLKYILQQEIL